MVKWTCRLAAALVEKGYTKREAAEKLDTHVRQIERCLKELEPSLKTTSKITPSGRSANVYQINPSKVREVSETWKRVDTGKRIIALNGMTCECESKTKI